MHKLYLIVLFLCAGIAATGQQDTVVQRIILVGDAGQLKNGHQPELELISQLYPLNDSNNAVVYLGDNIYPIGLPALNSPGFEESRKVFDFQLNLLRGKAAKGIVIPGNHDWMKGRPQGPDQLKHQENYVKSRDIPNLVFLPAGGCPGPVEVPLSDSVVMIVVDSQWWLQRENRPGETSDCDCKNEDEVVLQLKDLLYKNRHKLVVYAAHHPFKTYGEHGGYFTWKQHIFPLTEIRDYYYLPLPVIGSIYPLARGTFGNIQDLNHPEYKDYIRRIDDVLSTHPNCIRVAGHEHTLQYIEEANQQYIVSGAGSKKTQVKKGKGSLFAYEGTGFGVLELLRSGDVLLKFYSTLSPDPRQAIFVKQLNKFVPGKAEEEKFVAQSFPDSMVFQPAPYYKAGSFKRWLMGSNYREEWTTPVKVRTFNISSEKGGLVPIKRGGGFQSKSLRLEDKDGIQYVLRSIEKFPDRTLPEELRQTFVKDAVVDGVSASYPYAALSVPPLAAAAGITHAQPEVVYVPDDPALKQYRSDFANGLYLFEEREPGPIKKTYNSPEVFELLQEDNDNSVDQKAVLNARLLDMFIMDFDRHEDQWRWVNITGKKSKDKIFNPVPRDRDQPFFINNGVIPIIISRSWILPKFQGFRKRAENINTFNFNARYFDRSFLNGLSESDWSAAIDSFLPRMTDQVIDSAMARQPDEVKPFRAAWIAETLKQRRAYFTNEMMRYYRFLEKEVDVVGSDKRELFDVSRNSDGTVDIKVFKINKEGAVTTTMYDRRFSRKSTKEIRLWAQGGNDSIRIHGDDARSIKLRVIGGTGVDQFINESSSSRQRTLYYDDSREGNVTAGNGNTHLHLSSNPEINHYDRKAYKYNIVAPLLSAAFNPDDGVFLGVSVKNTRHGFRKDPHKIIHFFRANKALATGAYLFKYRLDATDVIGKTDIVAEADIKAPDNVQNFFGIGNETVFENEGPKKIAYYRSRYNLIQGFALLRSHTSSGLALLTGPVFQHYWMNRTDNQGRFISEPDLKGVDTSSLYDPKSYLGWQFEANIDTRENDLMPTHGVLWRNTARVLKGVNKYANDFAQLSTDLSVYLNLGTSSDIVLATRIGAGISFGNYEFFQAQYLSGLENLRGFRKFRFAGDKALYNNIDLRLRVADFRGYILPGSLGLVLFHDVGRVWVDEESSNRWHNGYGGGIWLSPGKRYIVAACYGFSRDGGLPFLTLGFQF